MKSQPARIAGKLARRLARRTKRSLKSARSAGARRASRTFTRTADGAVVLLYHSISAEARDPFQIRVQPRHFLEHLDALQSVADVVPLTSIRERGHGRRVAITFDDGYADNALVARPILEDAGMPATIFVASDGMSAPGEFWWDRLEHLLLDADPVRPTLELELDGRGVSIDVDTPEAREQALHLVWRRIVKHPLPYIEEVLTQLAEQLGNGQATCDSHRRMTHEEVRDLIATGLIDVGGHTRSHTMLSALSSSEQLAEIKGGREALGTTIGRPVVTFAYPYGGPESIVLRTPHLVKQAGFSLACTTEQGRVTRWTTRFRVPRLAVSDWDRGEFARRVTRALDDAWE